MKHTLRAVLFCAAMICCYQSYPQGVSVPIYNIMSQPGATLAQVLDTIYAHMDPDDTGEGGARDRFTIFSKIWSERVVRNDSSGINMFDRYNYALRGGDDAAKRGMYQQQLWRQVGLHRAG